MHTGVQRKNVSIRRRVPKEQIVLIIYKIEKN